jgi:hypothetical protein
MGTLRISSSEIKSICLSRLWLGLLASALVLVLAGSVLGQRPTTLFTKTYGGTGDDVGYCVEQTSDGGFIIVAKTNSFGAGSYDIYVLRTDAYGDTLWHRTYGQTGYEDANKIRETLDGGFVIAGRTQNGDDDAYLLKIDAGGDTVWTRTYGGGSNDQVFGVEQTADGGYILVGTTRSYGAGTPGYSNAWVIRTDANGYILWTNTYGGSSGDAEFHSVKELPSGGFVLTGHSESFTA